MGAGGELNQSGEVAAWDLATDLNKLRLHMMELAAK